MGKRDKSRPKIQGTHLFSSIRGVELDPIRSLILKRRLQVLVHSAIYYKLDTSLISDQQWQEWSQELIELQEEYPYISSRVQYYKDFKDFDGTSGYELPITNPEIMEKAMQLIR